MHNLMVNIGLLFSLAALIATTHALYLERRWSLFGWGAICILLALLGAAMYHGNIFFSFLPVVQKVSLVACIGFVIAAHYALGGEEGERMAASKSVEPAR